MAASQIKSLKHGRARLYWSAEERGMVAASLQYALQRSDLRDHEVIGIHEILKEMRLPTPTLIFSQLALIRDVAYPYIDEPTQIYFDSMMTGAIQFIRKPHLLT